MSGVSSGGYMAVQSHVAYSEKIGGVGVVAGGPYHCAEGDIQLALGRCMTGEGLGAEPMILATRAAADAGEIADTGKLGDARVWVLHSPADAVVSPRAGDVLADFYGAFADPRNVEKITHLETAHGWPTVAHGLDCAEQGGDYINACDFDTAGQLLRHIYGDLQRPPQGGSGAGLVRIDLSPYFASGSNVADEGFAVVPDECADGAESCRLHIAFHGCVQGAEFIEDRFALNAGFNEWADANAIVVIYPQLESSLFNPKGCWDWWGYTGDDYDRRSGKQVAGVSALIDAFVSGTLLERMGTPDR